MSDLKSLIAPLEDGDRYVFRLNHARVYYVKLSIANLATSISRDALLSLGTCIGKMTKTGKFRLHITALPIIAAGARHKIWVKENGAQPFLYGSNGNSSPSRWKQKGGLLTTRHNSRQGARRPLVRGLPRAPGLRGVQHGGHSARVRRGGCPQYFLSLEREGA